MNLPLKLDNRFSTLLPADPVAGSNRRQVHNACFSFVDPTPVTAPALVAHAIEVASLLGLSETDCQTDDFLQLLSGNALIDGMQTYAMCYGGINLAIGQGNSETEERLIWAK